MPVTERREIKAALPSPPPAAPQPTDHHDETHARLRATCLVCQAEYRRHVAALLRAVDDAAE